ncbi:MAG: SDR family NAD(P)-dependent oxidoreductase, partial [Promethearchaeia archaeon]
MDQTQDEPMRAQAVAVCVLVTVLGAAVPGHGFLRVANVPRLRARGGAAAARMEVRRVLVTGANKGIGLATAEKLLCDFPDCHVLLGARSAARGEAAVSDLLAKHPSAAGRVDLLELDVSSDESVSRAAGQVADAFGTDPAPLWGII